MGQNFWPTGRPILGTLFYQFLVAPKTGPIPICNCPNITSKVSKNDWISSSELSNPLKARYPPVSSKVAGNPHQEWRCRQKIIEVGGLSPCWITGQLVHGPFISHILFHIPRKNHHLSCEWSWLAWNWPTKSHPFRLPLFASSAPLEQDSAWTRKSRERRQRSVPGTDDSPLIWGRRDFRPKYGWTQGNCYVYIYIIIIIVCVYKQTCIYIYLYNYIYIHICRYIYTYIYGTPLRSTWKTLDLPGRLFIDTHTQIHIHLHEWH